MLYVSVIHEDKKLATYCLDRGADINAKPELWYTRFLGNMKSPALKQHWKKKYLRITLGGIKPTILHGMNVVHYQYAIEFCWQQRESNQINTKFQVMLQEGNFILTMFPQQFCTYYCTSLKGTIGKTLHLILNHRYSIEALFNLLQMIFSP